MSKIMSSERDFSKAHKRIEKVINKDASFSNLSNDEKNQLIEDLKNNEELCKHLDSFVEEMSHPNWGKPYPGDKKILLFSLPLTLVGTLIGYDGVVTGMIGMTGFLSSVFAGAAALPIAYGLNELKKNIVSKMDVHRSFKRRTRKIIKQAVVDKLAKKNERVLSALLESQSKPTLPKGHSANKSLNSDFSESSSDNKAAIGSANQNNVSNNNDVSTPKRRAGYGKTPI